jgi:hypothetical protein
MQKLIIFLFFLHSYLVFGQCPPAAPTAPICTNTCASTTAASNDNLNTNTTRCFISGTSTFGTYGLNGGTLVVTGGDLTVNNFDIGNAASTIIVTGGTVNISWRNLNTLGNLLICGGTVNVTGGNYNQGFNFNVGSAGRLNINAGFNALGNFTISNAGTVGLTGNVNLNNSTNTITNSGTILGSANMTLNSGTNIINNTGTMNLNNLTVNSGTNSINMGNNATLNINNLSANNTANSFCVAPGSCANFNVAGTAQMTNPLSSSAGLRYCGPTTGFPPTGGLGSATSSCVSCLLPLPVTWIDFYGILEQKSVKLIWKTINEINTNNYEIEYSTDEKNYTSLGKISSANKISLNEYSFTHNFSNEGIGYYKIKQIDKDNAFSYSKIIAINKGKMQKLIKTIFPNPTQNHIYFQLAQAIEEPCQIQITDLQGIVKYETMLEKLDANINLKVDFLAKGVYFLRISTQDVTEIHKFCMQ